MVEFSIPAVLQQRAGLLSDETAFTFVDYQEDWAGVAQSLTWSQLHRRTSNLAQQLMRCGATGDRAVILAPQGLDYIVCFVAALQAGLIAVPLSVPYGGAHDERTSSVLADTSPAVILTASSVVDNLTPYVQPQSGKSGPAVLEVDLLDLDTRVPSPAPGSGVAGREAPETLYLQYTSGSTRTPAGVMVSNESLFANFDQIMTDYFGEYRKVAPPDTTVVSWLPFYHDMGFMLGIIFPILTGVRATLTSPVGFLQRPARWMQMLGSNTRALSAAPNFAFDIAARKTSDEDVAGLDLSGVHAILNGAERVQPASLKRFADRFARFNLDPAVLRPSYGMAEATVYIATRKAGEPPKVVNFDSAKLPEGQAERCESDSGTPLVSYGTVDTQLVRIVDPDTSIECPAGTVGEIWVHGANVACGYWQKPEETKRTFGATIVDPTEGTPERPWLRTGDSGFRFDGELFIIGRLKDLLIVYGRNHSPDDIEATISQISRRRCVAIAVPDDDGVDKPVAIVELRQVDESEDAAMKRMGAIRRDVIAAVSKSHGLSMADVVLVAQGSIPITTSGKVRRRECLQRYLRDEFTRLDAPISRPERRIVDDTGVGAGADRGVAHRLRTLRRQQHDLLVGLVCEQAATVLGRPSADDIVPDWSFQDLGFDSVKATELIDRLKDVTQVVLSPALVFDYPTPAALATYLGRLMDGSVAAAPQVALRRETDEPVAVVGMACRFPGGVDSAAALWDLVVGGVDAVGGFPVDRGWNLAELFDADPDAVGKTYTRAGAFLAEPAGFDAEFFGISGREAQAMDPQQRVLLEVCWEALETARIDPAGLAGSQTGVFVGSWAQAYGGGGSDGAEGYALTGVSTSVASGRVAYALGLQGPAITVDTACSSSLVATHLACQSLRHGESALALAGGVTVMPTPMVFTEFARQRGLAVDGRCKAFAAAADGTGFGEGAAVLVLERLGDAQRHGHPVLAVIVGSAINQDGASNGLTAPSGLAQQRVITQAVANAGIGFDQVDVVEAHGTGTTLGDPIEAGALIATYGAGRGREHPLWLGSVKSNIGHTQAAAGVAGVIKMVEALNHDSLPPTLHVDRPSPHIDWSAGAVRLLTEAVPWPVTDHPRTAAVSSFGISGTNAHVILRQAPVPAGGSAEQTADAGVEFGLAMWPVSARSPAALGAQARRLHRYLVERAGLDLTDVAYSLATTRTHHPYRAVITASVGAAGGRQDLLDALDALGGGRPHPQLVQHHYLAHLRGKTVFVLPGQGGQYLGMGRGLYERHRVFAGMVDACDEALRPFTGWSVREVLGQDPAAAGLDRVDVVQPVLFTMMVSLAEVLGHYGIVPDAVVGHSQGEIAAAYIAGVFSLAEAARVVERRSQALSALGGAGGMASVLLGAEELHPRLRPWGQALSIAAINGPSHTIVSGDPGALGEFSAACERDGVHIRQIAVDYASHSVQVEPVRERLVGELAELTPMPARIPLYSTVEKALSAEPLDTTTMDAEYWYRNLREPVRFHDTVVELLAAGECTFVELSPHPVLAPALTDTLAQTPGRNQSAVIPTLHRERPDHDSLASTLAQLHNHGHSPSWSALYPHARTVALPTYPFQHRPYWLAPTPTGDARGLGLDPAEHPLLSAVAALADQDQIMVSGRLSLSAESWLAGHQVKDTVLFPAAGFIEVILRAGELSGCPAIDELILHAPLVLSGDAPTDLQIVVQPFDEHGRRPFNVHSRTGGQSGAWMLHASGTLSAAQPAAEVSLAPAPGVASFDQDDFYERLAQRGYRYSGLFRSVRGIATDAARSEGVQAEVTLPAGTDVAGYGIHPALLDAALHPLAAVLDGMGAADSGSLRLPFVFTGVTLYATAATQLHVQLTRTGEDTFELRATDPTGAPVITISAVTLRTVSDRIGGPAPSAATSDSLFELTWLSVPDLPGPSSVQPPGWAVCADAPERLPASLSDGVIHADLATLTPCPELVIWPLPRPGEQPEGETDPLRRVHALTRHVLAQVQSWLSRPETANTQLMIITSRAVSVGVYDGVPDLAHAAVWALIHTAQQEQPDRIIVLDTDDSAASKDNLLAIASRRPAGEPQLALRNGVVYTPRLSRMASLSLPDAPDWHLATTGKGDLANLTLVPASPPTALASGQVRIQVRAAGLNFHDVVVALGAIADEGLGAEAAGVVVDTAPDVTSVRPGDAVMGLFPNAFSPTAITDHRAVVVIPPGWSFAQAASVPTAFLTAYIALVELAGLSAGQRVLIHAGAGAVGQAAIQIARHLGAEVFATAHPNKHQVLNELGVDCGHIASSRTLDFVDTFSEVTGAQGMDVVLNSLRGDFVDASLQLLPRGGSFVEIGKTDIRLADDVAAAHPGVDYQAYDLGGVAAEVLLRAWAALLPMFAAGVLKPLPTTSYGLLNAPQAFRDMSQARHTGKIVLTPPAVLDPEGTVLITGGTGMIGALVAEHLVTRYGIRHLLLLSRRGLNGPGASELQQRLAGLGAQVAITACDISDPAELAEALDTIAADHPLTAVIHAAGVLDDAVVAELSPQQLDAVLAAKADAAWHLHRLTADRDLAAFILFSSAAGILGSPGQANYAAANALLDALARRRHHTQHPATSVAWGYWQTPSGMTAHLSTTDLTRIAGAGLIPITTEQGLALFDAALASQRPNLVASPVNTAVLTRRARNNALDPILSALTTSRPRAATVSPGGLAARLASQTAEQQLHTLTTMVASATAAVLAHPDPAALDIDRPFKDLGIDSLTTLELRNTLNQQTGLTLPATLAFDYPTPAALARHLREQLSGSAGINGTQKLPESEIQRLISIIPEKRLAEAGVLAMLREIAEDVNSSVPEPKEEAIASMSLSELMSVARENKSN
ncbi:type I polyketide synthase [Mycobacterium lacus]|uniref:type I polyketide synthase n=1 Tax=Mycobacterium lacus TaxID=169765 RepID=UPI000A152540|nr:type I polyketide synthase [Mycobacterium lacus]